MRITKVSPDDKSLMEMVIMFDRSHFDGVSVLADTKDDYGEPYALIDRNRFIGYIIYGQIWLPELNHGYISRIAVIDVDRLRRGLGTLMLRYAISDLRGRGCDWIQIDVKHDNCASLGMFQNLGFCIDADFEQGEGYENYHRLILEGSHVEADRQT